MFRGMRRMKQQLSIEECEAILKKEPRGVLAIYGEDGYPYAFPMNQFYVDGSLYFHCAKVGHKIDALAKDNRVSFCVMDEGYRKEGEWPLNIKSVIAFGTITKITDPQKAVDVIRKLALKHYPTPESVDAEIAESMKNVCMLELKVDHMTGKLVNES